MRINNYPVVTGKSGLCRANLDVGVLVIASPQQDPPAPSRPLLHLKPPPSH